MVNEILTFKEGMASQFANKGGTGSASKGNSGKKKKIRLGVKQGLIQAVHTFPMYPRMTLKP